MALPVIPAPPGPPAPIVSISTPASASSAPPPTSPNLANPEPPSPLPDILPALGITLLAGAPGTGKTALLATMARDFAQGRPIFGRQPSPIPKVALISSDRSFQRSTRLWFDAAGYPDIAHYSLQDDRAFSKSRLRNKYHRTNILRECLDKLALPWGALVFVDTLALFLGGNLLDYDTCMVACTEIRDHCQDLGITIIGTAHASKQKADPKARYLRLQDRIAGSTALFGYTDTQMYLASPEEVESRHYAFLWHPHHAPAETFELTRNERGLFELATPLESGAPSDNQIRLLDLIPYQTDEARFIRVNSLAAQAQAKLGISKASVERYLLSLEEAGMVVKVTRGKYARSGPERVQ